MASKFRPLTDGELTFVGGGYDMYLNVGGTRPGGGGGGYGGGFWGGGGGYETTLEPDYGGWDPEPQPEPCSSHNPEQAAKEQQVDDAAIQAGSAIASALGGLPGVVNPTETREFGAIIYIETRMEISAPSDQ